MMKKTFLVLFAVLAIACSSDKAPENTKPVMQDQEFSIRENSPVGTAIGVLNAYDPDQDDLLFTVNDKEALVVEQSTRQISVGPKLLLDYETNKSLTFTVTVDDDTETVSRKLTLNLIDEIERDFTPDQLALVNHFTHLLLGKSPTSANQLKMVKWMSILKLYLDGPITEEYRTVVDNAITEFNAIFTKGSFRITVVPTIAEANVHLFLGTREELAAFWPDVYPIVKDKPVTGYTYNDAPGNTFTNLRMWVSNDTEILFKHELGHVLGLGHSESCSGSHKSYMCSEFDASCTMLPIDVEVLRYLYHDEMPSGLNEYEIGQKLAELLPKD